MIRRWRIGKSVGVVIPYNEIEYYAGSCLEWLVETTIMLKNIWGCMIDKKIVKNSEGCGHDLDRDIVLELAEWSDETRDGPW